MGGDNLHLATFKEGVNILTLSKGEREAVESLDYSRFVHDNLPDFLRLSYDKNQEGLLTFPAMQSKIRALSSTEDAGVGFGGATRVVMDEFEYHPYDRKNYAEIVPPIMEGGQLVILSTADKWKTGTLFKELYIAAKRGDNMFYPIFFPYDVLPNRTPEWWDALPLPIPDKECRYPRNEDEALESIKSRRFFDNAAIELMYQDIGRPVECLLSQKYPSVRIYKLPVIGKRYCLFTDPSDGKEDPHATIVIDQTGEQVAESHGKVPADMCALIHDELVRFYNVFNAYDLVGGAGMVMRDKLRDLGTPNQCPTLKMDLTLDATGKTGWWGGGKIWNAAIWGLEEAIRLRQIIPRSKECLDEFKTFVVEEGKDPAKLKGTHDDYIDAWSRVLLLRKYLPFRLSPIKSYPYKQV